MDLQLLQVLHRRFSVSGFLRRFHQVTTVFLCMSRSCNLRRCILLLSICTKPCFHDIRGLFLRIETLHIVENSFLLQTTRTQSYFENENFFKASVADQIYVRTKSIINFFAEALIFSSGFFFLDYPQKFSICYG